MEKKRIVARWVESLICVLLFALPFLAVGESFDVPPSFKVSFQQKPDAVQLSWLSDRQESFTVLWRSNVLPETKWITLTNLLRGSQSTNFTTFLHHVPKQNGNLADLYRVLLVPDFWFDLNGVPFVGAKDFLPLYYGKAAVGYEKPRITLLVDGEDSPENYEESIEEVNFGTVKKPRWLPSGGVWLYRGSLKSGTHTLQIKSTIPLNFFVELGQDATVNNRPVRVSITNSNSISSSRTERMVRRPDYTGAKALEERLRTRPCETLTPSHN